MRFSSEFHEASPPDMPVENTASLLPVSMLAFSVSGSDTAEDDSIILHVEPSFLPKGGGEPAAEG